ncbi:MAG: AIR synthase related protein [Thermomicrobiales bacterium]
MPSPDSSTHTSTTPLRAGKLPGPLLHRLIEAYATVPDDDVIVPTGYGRDAAAIQVGDRQIVVKSDPITFATDGAARYLVAVNANDIACLGGIPRWLTVVALLPEGSTTEGSVETLFAELQSACNAAGVALIGGHTEVTLGLDRPLLVGTMIGVAGPHGLLEPGNLREGDDLYLANWAGIEGTALLAREHADRLRTALGDDVVRTAAKLLRSPGIAVAKDAAVLIASGAVRGLHDPTEGGVATAIHELAEASGLGVEVQRDAIPLLPQTRILCDHYGIDPLGLLSSGALLVAADPVGRDTLRAAAEDGGVPLAWIGTLTAPDQGLFMVDAAGRHPIPRYDSDEITRVL